MCYEKCYEKGAIMMGYYEGKGYYTLWKLMIDRQHQGCGYGKAALELGINFLRERFRVKEIFTGVIPENKAAKSQYHQRPDIFGKTTSRNYSGEHDIAGSLHLGFKEVPR